MPSDSRSRSPRRSHSPPPRRQSRSRSPRRNNSDRPRRGGGGFGWKKEKPRREEDARDDDGLQRGYRANRSPPRGPRRDEERDGERRRERSLSRERGGQRREARDEEDKLGIADKFGGANAKKGSDAPGKEGEGKDKKKKRKEPKIAAPTEEMIIVTVNDRLGTKAQIPCLASDPIKLFKAQVAARIGRQPHEIMLKRQGERPFKDILTLADYGVSNGVQLDLELDTGD